MWQQDRVVDGIVMRMLPLATVLAKYLGMMTIVSHDHPSSRQRAQGQLHAGRAILLTEGCTAGGLHGMATAPYRPSGAREEPSKNRAH